MGVITRQAFSKALWEGINSWYMTSYAEHPEEWRMLFDTFTSNKAFEEDVGYSGLGLASVKPEGEPVAYDSMSQGFITRYTHVEYGLGFIVTNLMIEDDLYGIIANKRAAALARSMRQTKEVVAANVYNRAFTNGYTGGDGVVLGASNHPNIAGGTYSNIPSVAVDLNEASLEQACIDISKWTDDRGLAAAFMPNSLHLPYDLQFEVARVLESPLRVGTAENDINALKLTGKFPGGYHFNHYFTDTDAWFIRTDCPDGMKYFERRPDSFDEDNEFETKNLKYIATARYSFGWTDPKAIYCSAGA